MLGTTAVVEMGSGSVRAGLAGEAAPRVVRSSACASNGTRPVSKGRVVDRELWEATLHGALTDVLAGQRDERKETGLVLVHRPDEPAREKERASEFVFERYVCV
jgi:actin-related protein